MDTFVAECLEDEYVKVEMEELQHEINVNDVSNIEAFLRKRLEKWREVDVNIAVTGYIHIYLSPLFKPFP